MYLSEEIGSINFCEFISEEIGSIKMNGGTKMEFVKVVQSILKDVQLWLTSLIGGVTVAKILILAVKHQAGDAMEKEQSVREIKKSITMCAGAFFLVWFVSYLLGKVKGLA